MKFLFVSTLLMFFFTVSTQAQQLIFEDDFSKTLDMKVWKVEMEQQPNSSVFIKDGNLILDTQGGVTVWLNRLLKGNYVIEYTRTIEMDQKVNDRLSDLNQFWMAKDPWQENLFTRSGALASYDSLQLYYVGMGGNYNSTTRFRKYQGNGERTLLLEYADQEHMLLPNHSYTVRTVVLNGKVSFYVDGKLYFTYDDPTPLQEGYFGFRSTKSRQSISEIKIYQLD